MADVRPVRNPTSIAGMVLTTASAVLFLIVFLADLLGWHTNPYIGIVFFLILPSIVVFGLALIGAETGQVVRVVTARKWGQSADAARPPGPAGNAG